MGPWPPTETVFIPGHGGRITSGKYRLEGYQGLSQFQENFGLFYSATNDVGAVPQGEVDHSLILLQIR
jgi:hypothetical protein